MNRSDVQGIEIDVPASEAYAYIANPDHLPAWTNAFASVGDGRAVMATPAGETEIELEVQADRTRGTIDWSMSLPDGTTGVAYSRVIPLGGDRCTYSFVLTAPPVALEKLEGALAEQSAQLARELVRLKQILEHREH